MKLHLGCGKVYFPDWIHIDNCDFSHISSHDVTKLPYFDSTIEIIYASHLLEYFDRLEAQNVLKEWYRVLMPGGILRIGVPDFSKICKLYYHGQYTLDSFLGPLYGKMNSNGKTIYHKTTYDFSSLSELLLSIGFKNLGFWDWHNTPPHDKIDDCSHAYLPHDPEAIKNMSWDKKYNLISLNVEALK